jgi:SAM-dependent methyltransferase
MNGAGAGRDGEPNRPILFLHIPRTAGISLRRMAQEAFGWNRCLTDLHLFAYDDPAAVPDFGAYDFFEGHVAGQFFQRYAPKGMWPANGVTVLREPVARARSQAIHMRARVPHLRGEAWKAHLSAEVNDPDELLDRIPVLVNTQTKMLANRHPHLRHVDDDALGDAQDVLERLTFGLTEAFMPTSALFADRFDVSFPNLIRSNASPASGNDDLRSDAFADALRRNNHLDLQLYEYASELFWRRATAFCERILDASADDAKIELSIRVTALTQDGKLVVASDDRSIIIDASILIDGHPADAVFARVGDLFTPMARGTKSFRLAEATRDFRNRFAGVIGTVRLTEGASEMEFVAFDESRKLRGSVCLQIVTASESIVIAPQPEPVSLQLDPDDTALPVPPEPENHRSGSDDLGQRGQRQLELLQRFGLQPTTRVVEIGCGIGRLAHAANSFLDSRGSYTGFDVQPAPIAWLNENYAPFLPNFRFDVVRPLGHRPTATRRGLRRIKPVDHTSGRLPYDDDAFDFVCAFAVFTRMSLPEIKRQLAEAARIVRAGGVGVFTINAVAELDERPLDINGRPYLPFDEGIYSAFPDNPRKFALAFDEDFFESILRTEGWTLVQRLEGAWHRRKPSADAPSRPTLMPFHGSDVYVVTPTVQKIRGERR